MRSKTVSMATMEEVLNGLIEQQKAIAMQMEEQNQRIEEQQRLFGRMMKQIKRLEKGNPSSSRINASLQNEERECEIMGSKNALHFYPRVEFPLFDGVNA